MTLQNESQCNQPCANGLPNICGGDNYFSVYSSLNATSLTNISTLQQCNFTYIGCYADVINSNNRDLNGLGLTLGNFLGGGSLDTCVDYCTTKGFLYAGAQNG